MAFATLTTKGQVSIPKKIREALKLHTGDKIEIMVHDKEDEAIIRPVSNKVDDIFCKLHQADRKIISIETMDNAIRERVKANFQ